jgi:hypothetical protein
MIVRQECRLDSCGPQCGHRTTRGVGALYGGCFRLWRPTEGFIAGLCSCGEYAVSFTSLESMIGQQIQNHVLCEGGILIWIRDGIRALASNMEWLCNRNMVCVTFQDPGFEMLTWCTHSPPTTGLILQNRVRVGVGSV